MVSRDVDAQVWSDVSNVVSEHIWRLDHGMVMEAFELFAASPRLEFLPPAPLVGAFDGHDAVQGWYARRARLAHVGRHAISNLRLTPRDDGSIGASHLLVLFRDGLEGRRATDPLFVADADEILVREGSAWRIASRVITPVFTSA